MEGKIRPIDDVLLQYLLKLQGTLIMQLVTRTTYDSTKGNKIAKYNLQNMFYY